MDNTEPILINAKAAAEYLGITYWSITELARQKKIPCVHVGNRPYFRKDTLDQWVIDQEKKSVEPERNRFGIRKIDE